MKTITPMGVFHKRSSEEFGAEPSFVLGLLAFVDAPPLAIPSFVERSGLQYSIAQIILKRLEENQWIQEMDLEESESAMYVMTQSGEEAIPRLFQYGVVVKDGWLVVKPALEQVENNDIREDETVVKMPKRQEELLDIPAFLRRQAD